ncbi:hypothetical protein [Lactobacillus delbrueckii]|uniref:hypothetical protein n=1 Tax=Lactobacillus delbrueckii TaxID=1584 RepID=UPI0022EBD700|nr:hypothetical protein [Lactobacillus delbrueckii]MDA3849585.1 hypothetical protein [Lactobacillus delbrueckii]
MPRLQPQAWWYTNHLLMRVKDDLPAKEQKQIKFLKGSQRRCKKMAAGQRGGGIQTEFDCLDF